MSSERSPCRSQPLRMQKDLLSTWRAVVIVPDRRPMFLNLGGLSHSGQPYSGREMKTQTRRTNPSLQARVAISEKPGASSSAAVKLRDQKVTGSIASCHSEHTAA